MRPSLADPRIALQTLTRFAQSLLRPNSLDELLWDLAQSIGDILGYEDCVIYLREPAGLVQVAAYGIKSPHEREIFNRLVLPIGKGIVGAVAASGRPERIADTGSDARYVHDTFSGKSELAVPILYGEEVLGVLDSESAERGAFEPEDEAMLVAIASLIAPRIASARAERDRADAVRALEQQGKEQLERERLLREERMEALGKLAGGIAHDFNNQLTAILGNLTMARLDVEAAGPRELLRNAEEACLRARGLTKQLLTFSLGGEPVRQPGDIGALAREAVAFALRGSRMQARFDVEERLDATAFDEGQMSHVFHSLAMNAVQACNGVGHILVQIRNRADLAPRSVEVRIQDDGPGIPPEHRSRIFDPFFTTRIGGTGLGLATSFWVMRRHGGTLHLDPTTGRGACFVLTLPTVEQKRAANGDAKDVRSIAGIRVIAVDDEPGVRTLLTKMGTRFECSIEPFGSSDAAIAAVRQARAEGRPYHVALLDLTMPGDRDGHATLSLLRAEDPAVRAIVTSGYHDDPVIARHTDFGFSARLEKPFSLQALQSALQQAIRAG